eukprot:gnl/TRDRNA2_/TRDRNA2_161675_c0_seq1.p1 gnl/TRDRNA2_/TRDRNA2_161675_c0~~gnl/TRDRNA2_/TRDRNA2_161675_c0_seq1.p1  ORF type:complete len:170 (+),score=31.90 gnl/TRDRNA2_/TRDRNA2_161675_c0_seq1:95-604(+)
MRRLHALHQQLFPDTTADKPASPLVYSDDYIKGILSSVRVIAVVGASTDGNKPSYLASQYMQTKGYRIIPVNPGAAGQEILGEKIFSKLADIPTSIQIDMVDVFRNSEAAAAVADDAIALKASHGVSVLWMQLDVINHTAADRATAAGLEVVMDRCPKIEYARLYEGSV